MAVPQDNISAVWGVVREDNILSSDYMVVFKGLDGYFRFLDGSLS